MRAAMPDSVRNRGPLPIGLDYIDQNANRMEQHVIPLHRVAPYLSAQLAFLIYRFASAASNRSERAPD